MTREEKNIIEEYKMKVTGNDENWGRNKGHNRGKQVKKCSTKVVLWKLVTVKEVNGSITENMVRNSSRKRKRGGKEAGIKTWHACKRKRKRRNVESNALTKS